MMASASSPAIPQKVMTMRPSYALAQICGAVKCLDRGCEVTLPTQTTVKEAVGLLSQEAAGFDGLMSFSKPKTEKSRERMRILLKNTFDMGESRPSGPDAALRPSRLWNATNAAELPPPKPASSETRAAVKQKIENQPPFRDLYSILMSANIDERLLAAISGRMKFSAVDGNGEHDLTAEIKSDYCLWDTGAYGCVISDDMFNKKFQNYLEKDPIHDPYRNNQIISVQVDCIFSLSNAALEMTVPFTVVPLDRMPNKRSGVILGQNGFLNQLVIKAIPRSVLEMMGTPVEKNIWGKISLEMFIDAAGELHRL
jgi:hypothetical protein